MPDIDKVILISIAINTFRAEKRVSEICVKQGVQVKYKFYHKFSF